jgi:hypothetical protein
MHDKSGTLYQYKRYKRVGTRKSWVADVVEVANEDNAETLRV